MMRRILIPVAIIAFAVLFGLWFLSPHAQRAVLHGWIFAAQFWTGLSLGAAVLLLIHAITGGRWGEALKPGLRAAAAAIPVAVLAWMPLVLSANDLFPWATAAPTELPKTVVKKLFYLDVTFLQIRTLVVLALFLAVVWAAGAWTRQRPGTPLATAMLMVYAFAISILAIDWMLAFEPEFYSTVYPPLHATGGVVAAMAFATLALRGSAGGKDRLEDCGMLMLGWAMVWLYLVFMQYLIIWAGDLPHEIHWYLVRFKGGWSVPLWIGILCNVAAMAAMVSPRLKRRPDAVAASAAVLVIGQAADLWWRIAPAFAERITLGQLIDLLALVALGAAWLVAAGIALGQSVGKEVQNG